LLKNEEKKRKKSRSDRAEGDEIGEVKIKEKWF